MKHLNIELALLHAIHKGSLKKRLDNVLKLAHCGLDTVLFPLLI